MRLNRSNQILIAVLVAQLVITTLVFLLPTGAATQPSGGPLLKDFKPESVTQLTIQDNGKNKLVLTKNSAGSWILPDADNFPATDSQITSFLTKVQALQTNRLIAQNTSSENRLEVAADNYQRLVEIKQGDKVDRLYIGSSGGVNATHMRLNDDSSVYLTSGLAAADASTAANSWVNTTYFTATKDNIVHLTLTNAQGTFLFDKVNGNWLMSGLGKGETLNAQRLDTLLTQVSSINLDAPLGTSDQDKYKMKSPTASISLTTREQVQPTPSSPSTAQAFPTLPIPVKPTATVNVPPTATQPSQTVEHTYTLTLGAKLNNGDSVLKASTSTYYVEILSGTADSFTTLKRTDLLAPPPTQAAPAAAPSGTPAATQAAQTF